MTKKKRYRVIFFLLVAVIVLCGFMVGKDLLTQKKEKDEFSELADIVVTEEEPGDENQPVDNPKKTKKRNIEKLIAKNGDCIGWIYIAGTEVNYPVMYSVNEPQKYLHRNFYGEYSYSGVPFLDARCSLDSQNLIVYGHNMNNGSMFATIRSYRDKEYYKKHTEIEFETVECCETYQVFAVLSVRTSNDWYGFIDTQSQEEYETFIEKAKSSAMYDTGIMPEYGQQILTLSTCSGGAKDERVLVLAVKK